MRYLLKCLPLFACVLLYACESDNTESQNEQIGLPDDFNEFYVRFHRDTAFQFAHISWPLKGTRAGLEGSEEASWSREEWTPHTRMPSSMEYDQSFNVLSDDMVIETIRDRGASYAMQRRFARMSDGWYMIYYVEMQPTKPPAN